MVVSQAENLTASALELLRIYVLLGPWGSLGLASVTGIGVEGVAFILVVLLTDLRV